MRPNYYITEIAPPNHTGWIRPCACLIDIFCKILKKIMIKPEQLLPTNTFASNLLCRVLFVGYSHVIDQFY